MRNMWDVISFAETIALELFLSVVKITMGAFWAWPGRSWNASWRVLEQLTPEDLFGLWLLVIGLAQLIGVGRDSWLLRAATAGVAIPTWSFVALSLAATSGNTVGWLLFSLIAVTNVWIFLRLRRRPHEP